MTTLVGDLHVSVRIWSVNGYLFVRAKYLLKKYFERRMNHVFYVQFALSKCLLAYGIVEYIKCCAHISNFLQCSWSPE
jgi:hypothetical protein